jgi:hypothetical protein
MGTAKAWYFAALGVVALSFSSSSGRCVFDKASAAIDQFRAKTLPYVAMLEMTLGGPQHSPQVHETMARVQETVAQIEEQKACTEARIARIQAMRDRLEAQRVARQNAMANQVQAIQDQVVTIPDSTWSKFSSLPDQTLIANQAVLTNRALARVQAWNAKRNFPAPHVTVTPNQVVIEGPRGMVVAPRPNLDINVPSFPARPTEQMDDPI